MGDQVLNIIITFAEALKANRGIDEIAEPDNVKYLLGQTIRQLKIPKDHYYISKKATDLWKQITTADIYNYGYHNAVQCDKHMKDIEVNCYKGSSNTPEKRQLKAGDCFVYRSVFHDEHMIPVSDIIKNLIKLDTLNCQNVGNVLDSIYICKMLKEEDRGLIPKYNRRGNIEQIINKIYSPAGIEIQKLSEIFGS